MKVSSKYVKKKNNTIPINRYEKENLRKKKADIAK